MYSRSLLTGSTGGSDAGTVRSSSRRVKSGMPMGMRTVFVAESVGSAAAERMASEGGCVWVAITFSPNLVKLSLAAHLSSRVERCSKNFRIRAAPAEIAAYRVAHVGLRGMRIPLEQRRAAHYHAWRAEAALHRVVANEGRGQRLHVLIFGDALDGGDLMACGIDGQGHAAVHRGLVEEHGAARTHAAVAADFGSGHIELDAQSLGQRGARLDVQSMVLAVDMEGDGEGLRTILLDMLGGSRSRFALEALHAIEQCRSRGGDARSLKEAAASHRTVGSRRGGLTFFWLVLGWLPVWHACLL